MGCTAAKFAPGGAPPGLGQPGATPDADAAAGLGSSAQDAVLRTTTSNPHMHARPNVVDGEQNRITLLVTGRRGCGKTTFTRRFVEGVYAPGDGRRMDRGSRCIAVNKVATVVELIRADTASDDDLRRVDAVLYVVRGDVADPFADTSLDIDAIGEGRLEFVHANPGAVVESKRSQLLGRPETEGPTRQGSWASSTDADTTPGNDGTGSGALVSGRSPSRVLAHPLAPAPTAPISPASTLSAGTDADFFDGASCSTSGGGVTAASIRFTAGEGVDPGPALPACLAPLGSRGCRHSHSLGNPAVRGSGGAGTGARDGAGARAGAGAGAGAGGMGADRRDAIQQLLTGCGRRIDRSVSLGVPGRQPLRTRVRARLTVNTGVDSGGGKVAGPLPEPVAAGDGGGDDGGDAVEPRASLRALAAAKVHVVVTCCDVLDDTSESNPVAIVRMRAMAGNWSSANRSRVTFVSSKTGVGINKVVAHAVKGVYRTRASSRATSESTA